MCVLVFSEQKHVLTSLTLCTVVSHLATANAENDDASAHRHGGTAQV